MEPSSRHSGRPGARRSDEEPLSRRGAFLLEPGVLPEEDAPSDEQRHRLLKEAERQGKTIARWPKPACGRPRDWGLFLEGLANGPDVTLDDAKGELGRTLWRLNGYTDDDIDYTAGRPAPVRDMTLVRLREFQGFMRGERDRLRKKGGRERDDAIKVLTERLALASRRKASSRLFPTPGQWPIGTGAPHREKTPWLRAGRPLHPLGVVPEYVLTWVVAGALRIQKAPGGELGLGAIYRWPFFICEREQCDRLVFALRHSRKYCRGSSCRTLAFLKRVRAENGELAERLRERERKASRKYYARKKRAAGKR